MFTINSTEIRKRIIELSYKAGTSGAHTGGALSLVELLCYLYGSVILDNGTNVSDSRDRVILSKGHGALALFCILEKIGLISEDELDTFESSGANYYAHAKRNINKGIEFSGGSLSLGISFSVGVALACRLKKIENQIYVILGDGECDEGLVWEAAMAISNYKLNNITLIVDQNGLQSDGFTKDVMNTLSLSDKFRSFGFYTQEIDGHSLLEIEKAFLNRYADSPNAIIAHTVKGKGISFMENERSWHHNVLSEKLFLQAMEDLENDV